MKGSFSRYSNDCTFYVFLKVENINWTLNIQAGSSAIALDAKSSILLQLGLTRNDSNSLTIEMDKSQLTDLYNHLEKIQSQVDAFK